MGLLSTITNKILTDMKRSFTKEELEFLKEYEKNFSTALELNYTRNIEPRYLEKIKEAYTNAIGEPAGVNMTCGHCVLAFIKQVGKKYFDDKKAYEALDLTPAVEATNDLARTAERATEMVKALDEVFNEVPDEPKKPVTKPKAAKQPRKRTK